MGIQSDIAGLAELKRLAEAATKGEWRYGPGDGDDENPVVFVDLPQASAVAISILFEADWATDVDAKFVSKANPAAVLALIAENERLRTAEGDAMTYKSGMENVAQQRAQLKVELKNIKSDRKACWEEFKVQGRYIDQLKTENEAMVTALNEILRVTPMGVEAFGIAALVLGEMGVSKDAQS